MSVAAPSKSLIFTVKINDFENEKSMTRERGQGLLWNMSQSMISTLKSMILNVKIIDSEVEKSMSLARKCACGTCHVH